MTAEDRSIAGHPDVERLVTLALEEDLGDAGDVTSRSLVPPHAVAAGCIVAKEDLVMAGHDVAAVVFQCVNDTLAYQQCVPDGARATSGDVVATVEGPAGSMLTAERTALNFLQRLCGIATLTSRFVDAVAGSGVRILDTRKTTPGMRRLEKYAVTCGGGDNHRFGLYDRVLIKDNHRRFWVTDGIPTLDAAVRVARRDCPGIPLEVEVESEEELSSALQADPDWVLLDNMTPEQLKACVTLCGGRAQLEASGGITLRTVAAVAASGVDAISLGCLTHSAPAVDLSLEISPMAR